MRTDPILPGLGGCGRCTGCVSPPWWRRRSPSRSTWRARSAGPWRTPLEEVVSVRPERDVYAVGPGSRLALADPLPALHRDRRRHARRRAGRLGDRAARRARRPSSTSWCCAGASCGRCRRTSTPTPPRPPGARWTSCRWSARRSSTDGRVLVAQRSGGPVRRAAGSSPAARSSRGSPTCRRWCASARRSWASRSCPQAFLGEVVLDGVVGGGAPGGVDPAGVVGPALGGGPGRARARRTALGRRADELDDLDWIAADRPLAPRRPRPPPPPLTRPATCSVPTASRRSLRDRRSERDGRRSARERRPSSCGCGYLKASLTFSPACLRLPGSGPLALGLEVAVVRGVADRLLALAGRAPRPCSSSCRCRSWCRSPLSVSSGSSTRWSRCRHPCRQVCRKQSGRMAGRRKSRPRTGGGRCRSCGWGAVREPRSQLDDVRGHPLRRVPRVHPSYLGSVSPPGCVSLVTSQSSDRPRWAADRPVRSPRSRGSREALHVKLSKRSSSLVATASPPRW